MAAAAAAVPLVEGAASTCPNRIVAVSKHLPSLLLLLLPSTTTSHNSSPSLYYNFHNSFLPFFPRQYDCLPFPLVFLFSFLLFPLELPHPPQLHQNNNHDHNTTITTTPTILYRHDFHGNCPNQHHHSYSQQGSLRPLFVALWLGDDDRGPRADYYRTVLVKFCFFHHPRGDESLWVIISFILFDYYY